MQLRQCENNEMTENLRFIKCIRGEVCSGFSADNSSFFSEAQRIEQII